MEAKAFEEAIQKALDAGKKRKFTQKIDLAINFRGLDFKKPENRVEAEVIIPNAFRESIKACVFAKDKAFASQLKGIAEKIVLADDILSLSKKEVKGLAGSFDVFYAEATAMVLVGKHLGQILAPRGKMPKPVPANPDTVKGLIQRRLKTVLVSNKRGKFMPVVHASIGTEEMPLDKLAENANTVYQAVLGKLEKGDVSVKSVFVKTTMGPAVRVVEKAAVKKEKKGKPVKQEEEPVKGEKPVEEEKGGVESGPQA